ncbi:Auxin-responsive protein IAA26 [Striga hermonthica]|uniref:Auxin-responsive protein n=1 Tax=Striga hermonthica TaxID=68872 RepID=A0A9N7NHH1_STRHE|nr:Auxin-responsive protein IAA26 [Striga hermonthica]
MEGCHQFLELIPQEREGGLVDKCLEFQSHGLSEDQKLELSLGPPGGGWTQTDDNSSRRNQHFVDFGCFPNGPTCAHQNPVLRSPWQTQAIKAHLAVTNEPSRPSGNRVAVDLKNPEKKAFSSSPANTAVPNNASGAQKRTAPTPVVGWPPIRSFRKNLASGSSSKSASDTKDVITPEKNCDHSRSVENHPKTLFVKINMDGVPIGRKVDLKAYDSYDKLSYAVDELFRGLLAAQSDFSVEEEKKAAGGLLNGNREYTLVYEDNEGDRMLVGDVPWHMFVSTVKRLRVLKSSELPAFSRGSKRGKQLAVDDASSK